MDLMENLITLELCLGILSILLCLPLYACVVLFALNISLMMVIKAMMAGINPVKYGNCMIPWTTLALN